MSENFKTLSLKVYTVPGNVSNLEWALWNSRARLPEKQLHDAVDELAAMQVRIKEADDLLYKFSFAANTLDHKGCDADCEYKQAAEYVKKYKVVLE